MNESPRLRLRRLLAAFVGGGIATEAFCAEFEHTYNMDLDKESLSPVEAEAFGALFEEVIWFSPLPDDLATVPNYRSERAIAEAAEIAAARLDQGG